MEYLLLLSLSIFSACILSFILLPRGFSNARRLPPGPPAFPFIGNLFWFRHTFRDLETYLRAIRPRYGPIITMRFGRSISIFVLDRGLAHKALIEHGAAVSDRPPPLPATSFVSANQHVISMASYGPIWRRLRRNLVAEILHPSSLKVYASGRSWALGVLNHHLNSSADEDGNVGLVVDVVSFQFAMFSLLVLMCFGEKLSEKSIHDIEDAHRSFILYQNKLDVLAFIPKVSMFIFRSRLEKAKELRDRQKELYAPLIRARKQLKVKQMQEEENYEDRFAISYVGSLLEITLPEEGGRGLNEDEIVALCSEFLSAGTDTITTSLQWIMANLVKHPDIQEKLRAEIKAVVGEDQEEVREEDLRKMPYLKAVITEGLRRHPPGHFLLPHLVAEDVELNGYWIPKGTSINFLVAEINMDEKAWEDPEAFKPERFMAGGEGEDVDITGSREIKMMPFGAGRRMCPGIEVAMLHLGYFVANMVREYEWKSAAEGVEVDMAEMADFIVVMKNPLRARLIPTRNC